MTPFEVFAAITTLAGIFSWINHRWLRLPTTIGLMVISMLFSVGLVLAGRFGMSFEGTMVEMLSAIDFDDALLKGMHKGTQHKGKVPPAVRRVVSQEARLAKLEAALKAAIAKEDFETAATLRDEIKQAKKAAQTA